MSDTKHYFHFTLGPVQGFVSQARRTRDFWAGSFILSWLAAVAIKAVHFQSDDKPLDKVILFPQPDTNYMAWLIGEGKENRPTQGSIPNRFKGLVAEVNPNTFNPHAVVESVQEAWKALAEEIWKADLDHVKTKDGKNDIQRNIWNRQINNFWDMSWVITNDEKDSSALDKRKNWRTYTPPEEPGVKCAMMDGWQELSGEKRPDRKAMNVFWSKVRIMGSEGMKSDLRENEALCAIAFVKRRFSRHFHNLNHTMSRYPLLKDGELVKDENNKLVERDGWQLKGWNVPSAVPSVTYLAAVHWLEEALKKAAPEQLRAFHDAAADLTDGEYGEWETRIRCLDQLAKDKGFDRLCSLDGNVFFESALENRNIFESEAKAKVTLEALKAVYKSADIAKPSPFYAILLMDGDSLGSHMSNTELHYSITQGLADFTNGVPDIVKDNNGFLIYAGGDDVLAILPLEDAINCAAKLREHYLNCFKEQSNDDLKKYRYYIPTTLSGAIEFTHINMPLTSVLKDAHHLLDEVAKDGSGRDALAIRVWKRGGLQLEWSQPWKIVLNEPDDVSSENPPITRQPIICEMVEKLQENQNKDADFSNKFFYKIRERFTLLNPAKNKDGKIIHANVLNEKQAIDLMTMEYLNSWGSNKHKVKKDAEELVTELLNQCRPRKRDKDKSKPEDWLQVTDKDIDQELASHLKPEDIRIWEADGALLVRFLAQKGVES